jgi:hypothetical protein
MIDTASAFLSVIAGMAMWIGTPILVRHLRSKREWARVQAIVLESEARPTGEGYYPHVRYRYEFGGRTYESNEIRSWVSEASRAGPARKTAARYPVGMGVMAYVNPSNPSEALLETHLSPLVTWVGIVTGGVLVAVGLQRLLLD